jgi:phosphate transport system permease protein
MTSKTKSTRVDRIYGTLTALLSSSAFLFLFLILGVLIIYSFPSFVVNGLHFFVGTVWNVPTNNPIVTVNGFKTLQGATYGMVVFFFGTLATSGLALLIGVPLALGIAIVLSQIAPRRVGAPISFLVELLAGIPSVIYGLWGFIVLGPILLKHVEPAMSEYLGFIPGFGGKAYSSGFLTAGIVLAIMIVPIVASISRDVMVQTPNELKEGGIALGMTNWEVTRKIILPYARTGILGSVILGLGRALGETMAVAMVSNGATFLPKTLYYPTNSIAAFLAVNFDGAFEDPSKMFVYSLGELALVLLAVTMTVNVAARLLVRKGFFASTDHMIQV